MAQSALDLLRQDQKASGLSVREYERQYGVLLSPPGTSRPMGHLSDILKHELHMSDMSGTIGSDAHCPRCARRLTQGRDRSGG